MTKHEKNKARSKRKKAERKALELQHWNECCKDSLVEWYCYCTWGCNCCGYHSQCSKCDMLYKQLAVDVKEKSK